MKKDDLSQLITQTAAAELRGCSRQAIKDLVRRGRLRTKEMFGKTLVYRDEIIGFKKENPGPKPNGKQG